MSLSPKDMDFIEAKNAAAREIALALGVPPMLLGIPGDNTYSNMQEATRMFWRQTVLPLVARTAKALSRRWLSPAYRRRRARTAPRPRRHRGPLHRARSPVDAHRQSNVPHPQRKARRGGLWAARSGDEIWEPDDRHPPSSPPAG